MNQRIYFIILGLIFFTHLIFSQTKTGTTIGQVLLIEPSARVSAMGNVGVSTYEEVLSVFYNPAAVSHLKNVSAQFTHGLWLADISYNYAAVAVGLGDAGSIFGSVTSLNSGEIDVRTVEQPLGTGEQYSVNNFAVGLGYGRQISDRFSVGLQVTYLRETIWHSSLTAFAINVGTIYRISPEGLRLGASISNFGTRSQYSGSDLRIQYDREPDRYGDNSALPAEIFTDQFSLPVLFRVGISLPVTINKSNRLFIAVDSFHPSDNTESISFGAEWNFKEIFSLRCGYQNLFQQDTETGLTLGAGIQYEASGFDVRFDYSWNDYGRLNDVQRFTIGLTF